MKLAFSTLGCPAWTLEQVVRFSVDAGYKGVELRGLQDDVDLRLSPGFQTGRRARTHRQFSDSGLTICCLGASASFGDSRVRETAIQEAREYIEMAADLDCRRVRVFGGHPGADETADDALRGVVDALAGLAPFAQAHKVTLVLETHDAFSTGAQVAHVLRMVNHPAVSALWDLHHPFRQGEAPADTLAALSPWLKHLHVKDSRDGQYCLLGQGDIPVRAMLDDLAEPGRLPMSSESPWLSVEWEKRWHPEIVEPEIALRQYALTLRAWMGDAA